MTTPAEVLAAVRQDGRALRHAAAALKEDREVAPRLQQRAMAVCLQPPRFDGEKINHSRARWLQCAFCAFHGSVFRAAGHISVTVTQSIGFEEALN